MEKEGGTGPTQVTRFRGKSVHGPTDGPQSSLQSEFIRMLPSERAVRRRVSGNQGYSPIVPPLVQSSPAAAPPVFASIQAIAYVA